MTTHYDGSYPAYLAGAGPDEADQVAASEADQAAASEADQAAASEADQAAASEANEAATSDADEVVAKERSGTGDPADRLAADEQASAAGQESGALAGSGVLAGSGMLAAPGTLEAPGTLVDSGTADSGSSASVESSTRVVASASTATYSLTDDQRWREILAGFVDDPQDAVREAAELIENDVSAYISLFNERRKDMISALASDQGTQTEELRQVLLACRDFSRRFAASLRAVR